MSFWDVIWFIIVSFAFMAYLMILFNILADIFRDRSTSGWAKAIWIVCLVIFPLVASIIYVIVRGKGMSQRQIAAHTAIQSAQDEYIRSVAGTSPADQISQARALLDTGTINQAEFDALKSKALA